MAGLKKLVQAGFHAVGLHVSYKRPVPPPKSGWDFFFAALKAKGFNPRHIIDVGVNHGFWTRTAIDYFPDAYYTLVEPQDWLKEKSRDILARGNSQWISAGAGAKPGTLPLWLTYRDDACSFAYSSETVQSAGGETVNVPIITLDQVAEASAAFPDMVKIDAEGFDLEVINGASKLIERTDVFILETTVCGPNLENTMQNVLVTMSRLGYRPVDIPSINRSPKDGVTWLCDIAFLRNGSLLFSELSYE
jgi:FkbM family methyltransferase